MSSSLAFTEPTHPHFDWRPLSLQKDGQSSALVSGCSPRSMFHGIWFPGFSLWLSLEPTTPCFSRKPPPLQGDGQSLTQFRFQSMADIPRCPVPRPFSWLSQNPQPRISTGSRHPSGKTAIHRRGFWFQSPAEVLRCPVFWPFSLTVPKPTTPHFTWRPPPLWGDGQLSAPLFRFPRSHFVRTGSPALPQPMTTQASAGGRKFPRHTKSQEAAELLKAVRECRHRGEPRIVGPPRAK